MTLVSLPLGAGNSGTNDWADVYNNDAAITAVLNGDVRNDNVAAAAAISYSKLATLNTGAVLLGNAGVPTATTLTGDVTVGATGVTAIGATKVTAAMLNADTQTTYKTLMQTASLLVHDAAAGTYMLTNTLAALGGGNIVGATAITSTSAISTVADGGGGTLALFPLTSAELSVASLTTKLNLRSTVSTNATAPGINFTFGLYPVTVAGTADNLTFTLGTVVPDSNGSGSVHTTPGASGNDTGTSGDFALPTNGQYAVGCLTSGTLATDAAVQLTAYLRYRNVT